MLQSRGTQRVLESGMLVMRDRDTEIALKYEDIEIRLVSSPLEHSGDALHPAASAERISDKVLSVRLSNFPVDDGAWAEVEVGEDDAGNRLTLELAATSRPLVLFYTLFAGGV